MLILLEASTAPKWEALWTVAAPTPRETQAAADRAASLNLLNESALNALLSVVILEVQKFMSRNELAPISSHPSMSENHELDQTSSIMDSLKTSRYTRKFKIFFSNLMYEKA